jgi:membrane dipeptidase
MIKAMAARGGVIQINYLDAYLDHGLYLAQEERQKKLRPLRDELERRYPGPENEEKRYLELRAAQEALGPLPRPSWEKIVEHIDHAVKAAGWEHVGLGSDFDGAPMPQGMEDCTRLPKITEALLRKGYTERQIKGVLGENLLGLMEKVEQVARGLQGPGRSPGP